MQEGAAAAKKNSEKREDADHSNARETRDISRLFKG